MAWSWARLNIIASEFTLKCVQMRSYTVAIRLTFLRILQVAHPCIFRRARPALGDWQRSGDDDDRGSDGIVAEDVPATRGGGGGARRVKLGGRTGLICEP